MEKVILSVYWPDEWKKIELNPSEWRKIKRGKSFFKSVNGYWRDGVRFATYWKFNEEIKGRCIVSYNNEGVGFEGSILDCEIDEIESRKFINLEHFLTLYESFVNIPTWTKQKYKEYEVLRNYLKSCRSDYILSSRDNKSTIITFKDSFTIFKVDSKKNGVLKQFREKWILMYMAHRYKFEHYLEIYPLKKGIDASLNQNLKMRFRFLYEDSFNND